MRTTVEFTGVVCPRCGEEYGEWRRHSMESDSPVVCPRCGFDLSSDSRLREEGVWTLEPADDEPGEI